MSARCARRRRGEPAATVGARGGVVSAAPTAYNGGMVWATRIARLALLVGSGLCVSQGGCRSQTAVAIVAANADAGDLPATRADGGDGVVVEVPADAVEVRADVAPEAASRDLPADVSRDSSAGPVVLFSDAFDGGYEVNWLLSESSDGPVRNGRD